MKTKFDTLPHCSRLSSLTMARLKSPFGESLHGLLRQPILLAFDKIYFASDTILPG
jgi:hypothetical protein